MNGNQQEMEIWMADQRRPLDVRPIKSLDNLSVLSTLTCLSSRNSFCIKPEMQNIDFVQYESLSTMEYLRTPNIDGIKSLLMKRIYSFYRYLTFHGMVGGVIRALYTRRV